MNAPPWHWLPLLALGCAGEGADDTGGPGAPLPETFDGFVDQGARILFVAAHPDDETLAGPLLSYACATRGLTCQIALFTRGEGGTCALDDCTDLGSIREAEAEAAAAAYGATLSIGTFPNHTGDALDTMTRDQVEAAWLAHGDRQAWLDEVFDDFAPDLVVSLDMHHGFTGHLEHQVAAESARRAAAARALPLVMVLNHYEAFEAFIGRDPTEATEEWDVERDCGGVSCRDATVQAAANHASQTGSILALVLEVPDLFTVSYLNVASVAEPVAAAR